MAENGLRAHRVVFGSWNSKLGECTSSHNSVDETLSAALDTFRFDMLHELESSTDPLPLFVGWMVHPDDSDGEKQLAEQGARRLAAEIASEGRRIPLRPLIVKPDVIYPPYRNSRGTLYFFVVGTAETMGWGWNS